MKHDNFKQYPTPEAKAECARLKTLWLSARGELGLSQEMIAAELGMTQGNLSHFLNGRQALTLDLILKLALRLGFRPSQVRTELAFLDPAFGGQPVAVTAPAAKPLNKDISEAFSKLDHDTKALILKLIHKLADKAK